MSLLNMPSKLRSWSKAEWKKNRDTFLQDKYCAWHGAPVRATVPHHPHKRRSMSEAEYVSMQGCIPLCQKCHYAARKRLKLCPVCKEHYFKPRRGRKMCWKCFGKTSFGQRVVEYYERTHVTKGFGRKDRAKKRKA
jgi:hypothetical protein